VERNRAHEIAILTEELEANTQQQEQLRAREMEIHDTLLASSSKKRARDNKD